MKSKLLTFFILLLLPLTAFSLDKEIILKKLSQFKTATADFEQITEIQGFGEDFYSGKIYLISKQKVLWDYTKPYIQYYIFTPASMEYYDSSTEQLLKQKVTQSGGKNIIFQILVDITSAKDSFNIIAEDNNKLRLIPMTDIGLKYIVLTVNDNFITEILSTDNAGNNTKVYLKNIKLNAKIDPDVFNKTVPLTTEVFEQ